MNLRIMYLADYVYFLQIIIDILREEPVMLYASTQMF